MTRCACGPASAYSAPPCCRIGDPEPCPASRCRNPREATAGELLADVADVEKMLAEAQERHRKAGEELQYSGDLCLSLSADRERLWADLQARVRRDAGGAEGLPETLTEAVALNPWRPPGDAAVNTVVDLG